MFQSWRFKRHQSVYFRQKNPDWVFFKGGKIGKLRSNVIQIRGFDLGIEISHQKEENLGHPRKEVVNYLLKARNRGFLLAH